MRVLEASGIYTRGECSLCKKIGHLIVRNGGSEHCVSGLYKMSAYMQGRQVEPLGEVFVACVPQVKRH